MKERIESTLKKISTKNIYDEQPIFCFTSDIDWASEAVMEKYFEIINPLEIKPTLYVTHHSDLVVKNWNERKIERGIHPNFLNGSSHGNSFKEIIETCRQWSPESYGFRSHRAFDVTDITHLLQSDYGQKYMSNQISILQEKIRPFYHESRLINFPVFFEDGTHLYNELDLDFKTYLNNFTSPGIKIISFHPMNFVFNSPTLPYMRQIKDSLSREAYNNINLEAINELKNQKMGIADTVLGIINFVKRNNYTILSMNELYHTIGID